MFEYFPGIYPWNLAIHLTMNMGGVLSEIEAESEPLLHFKSAGEPGAWSAWKKAWRTVGDRVRGLAELDQAAGHDRTAGKKLLRASLYYLMAERMMRVGEEERDELYRLGLRCFRAGVELMRERVEFGEVPYGDTALPALYVHPKAPPLDGAPGPCVVFFDGFDVNKEILYYRGPREELAERGIALLLIDHPGAGESLRFRGLPAVPEMERAGTAAYEYLALRSDVDSQRIGIMGVSLGGFYAPRAAAFEKRYACCVAWGASTRFDERIERALNNATEASSVTDMLEHARWVFGAKDNTDLREKTRRITMVGVADKITCPFLITHGEDDRQVPVAEAVDVYDSAINTRDRTLKIFTKAEGGVEHVNFDNPAVVIDYMADWIEAHLRKGGD